MNQKIKKDSKSKQKSTNRNFPFFVNDVYSKKRKKRNTRQTQTKKQLEWYLPNNVVCLP